MKFDVWFTKLNNGSEYWNAVPQGTKTEDMKSTLADTVEADSEAAAIDKVKKKI